MAEIRYGFDTGPAGFEESYFYDDSDADILFPTGPARKSAKKRVSALEFASPNSTAYHEEQDLRDVQEIILALFALGEVF